MNGYPGKCWVSGMRTTCAVQQVRVNRTVEQKPCQRARGRGRQRRSPLLQAAQECVAEAPRARCLLQRAPPLRAAHL